MGSLSTWSVSSPSALAKASRWNKEQESRTGFLYHLKNVSKEVLSPSPEGIFETIAFNGSKKLYTVVYLHLSPHMPHIIW